MAQPFSFGFGRDDNEEDLDMQDSMDAQPINAASKADGGDELLSPQIHSLDDLV